MSERFSQPPEAVAEQERAHSLLFTFDTKLVEHFDDLSDSVAAQDFQRTTDILSNTQTLENALIRKGPNGRFLKEFVRGVDTISAEVLGKGIKDIHAADEVKRLVENGLPAETLAWLTGAYYHLQDNVHADGLAKIIAAMPDASTLARAYAINTSATVSNRLKDFQLGTKLNREALTLVRNDPDYAKEPELQWAGNKTEYGLIFARAQRNLQSDMLDRLLAISKAQAALGDVFNAPRGLTDVGDLRARLGDDDKAIDYLRQAREGMLKVEYTSGAANADATLSRWHRNWGESRRSRFYMSDFKRLAEPQREFVQNEITEIANIEAMGTEPAACLIQIGDKFLIEVTMENGQTIYRAINLEQKQAGADASLRDELMHLGDHLARMVGVKEENTFGITSKKTPIFTRNDKANNVLAHKIELKPLLNETVTPVIGSLQSEAGIDGYHLMTREEIEQGPGKPDTILQYLLNKEQARDRK